MVIAEDMPNQDIIARRRVVNWAQRDDIQNEMRNDLDDYLFDVMRDESIVALRA